MEHPNLTEPKKARSTGEDSASKISEHDNKKRLEEMNRLAELGGGQKRIDDQHKKGKKTARERIEALVDEGSFVEIDKFAINEAASYGLSEKQYGDGVVTGYGTIDGKTVFLFAHDFT